MASLDDAGWQVPTCEIAILRPRRARYAVVMPVWNEGGKLWSQLRKMAPYLDLIDVVIADAPSMDGSTDTERLNELGVHAVIALREPGGQSSSLRTGLAYAMRAGFSEVSEMDGNDKDGPEAIPRFLTELDAGADYVQGSRYLPGGRGINTPRTPRPADQVRPRATVQPHLRSALHGHDEWIPRLWPPSAHRGARASVPRRLQVL